MLPACILVLLALVAFPAYADTKTLTGEATYIMGDGESPSFAEAMALQKAKQLVLEEAGTYVESYTKTINQDLTKDEIQTLAGGVLQVEVLEKTRTLVSEGLRIYLKIKATVTTDKMEELARRIKGKNIAEEYRQLQENYVQLTSEMEHVKQLLAKSPSAPERNAALDQTREREKAFIGVQQREALLFRNLVSGQDIVRHADEERDALDRLVRQIVDEGYQIELEPIKPQPLYEHSERIKLLIPGTVKLLPNVISAMTRVANSLGGSVEEGYVFPWRIGDFVGHINTKRALEVTRTTPVDKDKVSRIAADEDEVHSLRLREFDLEYLRRAAMIKFSEEEEPSRYLTAQLNKIVFVVELDRGEDEAIICHVPNIDFRLVFSVADRWKNADDKVVHYHYGLASIFDLDLVSRIDPINKKIIRKLENSLYYLAQPIGVVVTGGVWNNEKYSTERIKSLPVNPRGDPRELEWLEFMGERSTYEVARIKPGLRVIALDEGYFRLEIELPRHDVQHVTRITGRFYLEEEVQHLKGKRSTCAITPDNGRG